MYYTVAIGTTGKFFLHVYPDLDQKEWMTIAVGAAVIFFCLGAMISYYFACTMNPGYINLAKVEHIDTVRHSGNELSSFLLYYYELSESFFLTHPSFHLLHIHRLTPTFTYVQLAR